MLQLTLAPGEYFTVNGDIVVQVHRVEGGRVHVAVEAPREVPILRGAVLERRGGQRPACLLPVPEQSRRHQWVLWDQEKEDAVRAMGRLLDRLEGPEADLLRTQLERLVRNSGE